MRVAHAPALARGIRIVTPDRPGQGLSTRQQGRREIADWPDDVRALADALGMTRFAAVGISGVGRTRPPAPGACPARQLRRDHQRGGAGAAPDLATACASALPACSIWAWTHPG